MEINFCCWNCHEELNKDVPFFERPFVGIGGCHICGNKRCPHATDHRFKCTGSNEPGQIGTLEDINNDTRLECDYD